MKSHRAFQSFFRGRARAARSPWDTFQTAVTPSPRLTTTLALTHHPGPRADAVHTGEGSVPRTLSPPLPA